MTYIDVVKPVGAGALAVLSAIIQSLSEHVADPSRAMRAEHLAFLRCARTSVGCAAAVPDGGLSLKPEPGLVCICEIGTQCGGSSAVCSHPGSGRPKGCALCSTPAANTIAFRNPT